jgi:purine-cytosine permease-like protein
MLLKSFILRITVILTLNAAICYALMGATAYLMFDKPQMLIYLYWVLGYASASLFAYLLVRRFDSELLRDVAIFLYPSAAIISLIMAFLLSLTLKDTMDIEDRRHYVVILGGLAMVVSMVIHCMNIPWLLTKEELDMRMRTRSEAGKED